MNRRTLSVILFKTWNKFKEKILRLAQNGCEFHEATPHKL